MALELKMPAGASFAALRPILPVFASYVLSFVNVGIYWNNHHHMLAVTERVRGAVLWANLHLLFWLSLVPYVTEWMGRNPGTPAPTVVYGGVLFAAGLSYWVLQGTILNTPGQNPALRSAVGRDRKGKGSVALYAVAILLAFRQPWLADAIYVAIALIWLVPDRRIERTATREQSREDQGGEDKG